MEKQLKNQQCPEFPYFGAPYNDATCIDGFLHDLDDSPGGGMVYLKDDPDPCPFCNTKEFIKRHTDSLNGMPRSRVVEWVKKLKAKYLTSLSGETK